MLFQEDRGKWNEGIVSTETDVHPVSLSLLTLSDSLRRCVTG